MQKYNSYRAWAYCQLQIQTNDLRLKVTIQVSSYAEKIYIYIVTGHGLLLITDIEKNVLGLKVTKRVSSSIAWQINQPQAFS